jgi:hypothetical protein
VATPTFRLAQQLLSDDLRTFIVSRKAEGRSWQHIARDLWLATNHEIDVTGVTVQKWAEDSSEAVA